MANVILGICVARIGAGLTFAIVTGFGATIGALTPTIFKGTGLFAHAPGLLSPEGLTALCSSAPTLKKSRKGLNIPLAPQKRAPDPSQNARRILGLIQSREQPAKRAPHRESNRSSMDMHRKDGPPPQGHFSPRPFTCTL